MKKALIIFGAITLLSIFAFLGRKAGEFSDAEHSAFQGALWKLKHLDTAFNEDVLAARFGLLNNYDDFEVCSAQLNESLDELNKMPAFTTAEGRAAIESARNEYADLLRQRANLIEKFKSKNAVLANSRRYFPVAVGELAGKLGEDPSNRQLKSIVDDLIRLTLARLSTPETAPEQVNAQLVKLKGWCASHPEHPQAKFASSLIRHVRIITSENGELDNLIRQLLALPTEDSIRKLSLAYESDVSRALQRAGYYRLMLSVLGLLTVFGICYTLWALRAANRRLEIRVMERTRELAGSEERFRTLCLAAPIGIQMADMQGLCTYTNPAWEKISGLTPETCRGAGWLSSVHPDDHKKIEAAWTAAVGGGQAFSREYRLLRSGKETRWVSSQAAAIHSVTGAIAGFVITLEDITARKDADAKLESAHRKLVETSHQAGMAEVATNVLHNVGNVLNSVNISASLIIDKLKASRVKNLTQVADLFRTHAADLGTYITADATGKKVPSYIGRLAEHLDEEQNHLLAEADVVRKNIEHIKDIVAMQQNYAKISGVVERVKVSELIEDALRMNSGALVRHDVALIREYAPHLSDITVDKHKVLQILVNLIRNAKYACDESGRRDKQLTMRVTNGDDRVRISVIDNGVGIPAENMTRIFRHGFTTRKDGHGFGLHGAALAAKQMGGTLAVHSEGTQRGATFTLELPMEAPTDNE